AGLTVIIALIGLSVAGIPFLTSLGVAAAAGVAVAVLIAVTLTPAVLAMAGTRILSKKQRRLLGGGLPIESDGGVPPESDGGVSTSSTGLAAIEAAEHAASPRSSRAERFFGGWVKAVTAKPLITVLVVLIGLGAASLPAFSLRLA